MKNITQHLTQYAAYHRDKRNIITHVIGIPMIVISLSTLLARYQLNLFLFDITPAHIITALTSLFYLRLDIRFGIVMAIILLIFLYIGLLIADQSMAIWLLFSLSLFSIGWVFQLIGHVYEKRKPAFLDDLSGLAIGPIFVVSEIAFLLGFRKALQEDIEAEVGPTLIRS